MTSASPGLIAMFQPNEYYGTQDAYLDGAGRGDAPRVQGDRRRRPHTATRLPRSRRWAGTRCTATRPTTNSCATPSGSRGVERRRRRTSPLTAMRLHICWGNYAGPHTHDIPLAKMAATLVKVKPRVAARRGRERPARARMGGVARRRAPRRQGPGARRHRLDVEHRRTSRAGRRTDRAIRRGRRQGACDRRDRLRVRDVRRFGAVHPTICWAKLGRPRRRRRAGDRAPLVLTPKPATPGVRHQTLQVRRTQTAARCPREHGDDLLGRLHVAEEHGHVVERGSMGRLGDRSRSRRRP